MNLAALLFKLYPIRNPLRNAWEESKPGTQDAHEEGGFVLHNSAGNLEVHRWPKGFQATITVPPHPSCQFNQMDIVFSFHTHPNVSDEFLQEPSETDKRSVQEDPDLKGARYEGELVISQENIYLVSPNGQVQELIRTSSFF